ncbi:MAG TPA: protein translocase subunit SecD [Nocardioidaceae bacterium]|nr:protein translocase subunit SecD [Nocardioidaceae bacterium]
MAINASRPARRIVVFGAVLAAMFGGVALNGDWAPQLGLDLQGGTRITLSADTTDGSGVTDDKLNEAVDIIRQRVNGTGVAESEVTQQGGNQIVVEIPGEQRGDLAASIGDTAQLRFRLVAAGPAPGVPQQQPTPTPSTRPTGPPSARPNEQPSGEPSGRGGESPSDGQRNRAATGWLAADQSPAPSPPPSEQPSPAPQQDLEGAELLDWQPPPELITEFRNYQCPPPGRADESLVDDPDEGLVTCDDSGAKFLLSPTIIEGTQLQDASSGIPPQGVGYVVTLDFDGSATDVFGDVTAGINQTGRQFAIVLDGQVLSAPTVSNGAIRTGQAQISGNFTQDSARQLANSLRYGALPLSFTLDSVTQEGPELAANALVAGIVAGIVGLLLVTLYCLFYYRALGLVVVVSLLVAGLFTYAAALLLSETVGFTLTLPGIAGLIVAVGITADSFIVFFERLRDEVREGRTLRSAVEAGWERARMTILAADTVSFMAALVLYIFAIGVVKGFAFALGLVTLIDVLVVFFFTKPLLSLLARTSFFGRGHRLSGLDTRHLGVERLPGGARPAPRRTAEEVA